MTARGSQREPHLDHGDRLVRRTLSGERRDKRRALHLGQIAELIDKCPEILGFHTASLPPRIAQRVCPNIKSKQSHAISLNESCLRRISF